jgi:hypothetical protein
VVDMAREIFPIFCHVTGFTFSPLLEFPFSSHSSSCQKIALSFHNNDRRPQHQHLCHPPQFFSRYCNSRDLIFGTCTQWNNCNIENEIVRHYDEDSHCCLCFLLDTPNEGCVSFQHCQKSSPITSTSRNNRKKRLRIVILILDNNNNNLTEHGHESWFGTTARKCHADGCVAARLFALNSKMSQFFFSFQPIWGPFSVFFYLYY